MRYHPGNHSIQTPSNRLPKLEQVWRTWCGRQCCCAKVGVFYVKVWYSACNQSANIRSHLHCKTVNNPVHISQGIIFHYFFNNFSHTHWHVCVCILVWVAVCVYLLTFLLSNVCVCWWSEVGEQFNENKKILIYIVILIHFQFCLHQRVNKNIYCTRCLFTVTYSGVATEAGRRS